MKNNGSVTGNERHFEDNEKLISATDLNGVIQHCNLAFEKISGFSREELIGADHNLVRHPDMPPEAFEVMWNHLKAGRPWMGMVKNRCKNGDHYWVSAYVTPVTENGKVVGYESVRSRPSRADVARAEKLYQQVNAKRRLFSVPLYLRQLMMALAMIVPAIAFGMLVSPLASTIWLIIALLIYGGWQYRHYLRDMHLIRAELHGAFMHPLAVRSYTNEHGINGQLMVGVMSLRSHLDAVLTRIEDASVKVAEQSAIGLEQSEQARGAIAEQRHQTDLVATAMSEMSRAIHEISNNVQETAARAEQSSGLAEQGREVSRTTRQAIEHLRDTVGDIGAAVENLSQQTADINRAASSIEAISEKTNLLALNAAIEAARAGEHGRGFSIVADEVRMLAASTRESAQEIAQIVSALTQQARQSVDIAHAGANDADSGLQKVVEAEQMLSGIAAAVVEISAMAEQMATAVEEQALVSQDVNGQVAEISRLASDSLVRTEESAGSLRRSKKVSDDLHELVNRFRQ